MFVGVYLKSVLGLIKVKRFLVGPGTVETIIVKYIVLI